MSRVCFEFLLKNNEKNKKELAARFLETAAQNNYGGQVEKITNSKLVGWANGSRLCPKWAYITALHLALLDGWRPSGPEEKKVVYKTAEKATLPEQIEQIIQELNNN